MNIRNFVVALALLAALVAPVQAQFSPYGGLSPVQPLHVERSMEKVTGHVLPVTEVMYGGQLCVDGFKDGWMTSVITPGMKVIPINQTFYIRSHMDVVGDAIDNSVDGGGDRKKYKRDGHSDYVSIPVRGLVSVESLGSPQEAHTQSLAVCASPGIPFYLLFCPLSSPWIALFALTSRVSPRAVEVSARPARAGGNHSRRAPGRSAGRSGGLSHGQTDKNGCVEGVTTT